MLCTRYCSDLTGGRSLVPLLYTLLICPARLLFRRTIELWFGHCSTSSRSCCSSHWCRLVSHHSGTLSTELPEKCSRCRLVKPASSRHRRKAESSLSARGTIRKAQSRDFQSTSHCWEYAEHKCWDPKDGELCLARLKSGETLMEDRSDSDVQIDRRSWV